MKQFKQKLLIFLAFVMIITAVPILGAQAASGTMSVSISSANVNVGDNFTVTVSYSGSTVLIYSQWTLKYDSSLVSCGEYGGAIPDKFDPDQDSNAKSFSRTYTFTAKNVGTPSFSVEDVGVYNMNPEDGDTVDVKTSGASLKISAKGSSNANLSSLKLSAGSLSPAFSNDVSTYTVSVPNNVNSISISAVAADSKARVSVSGGNEVPEGSSSRVVIVTAEDGTVKKFTININREKGAQATPTPSPTPVTTPEATEGILPIPTTDPFNLPDELEVIANGAILVITDKPETVTLPAGFTEIEYTYRDRPVWAAQADGQDLLIMYLQDQADEKSGFYIYDETLDEFSKYIILYTQASSYTLLPRPETLNISGGYVEKTAVIDGENVTVWVPETMKYMDTEVCEFYLVYAMSQDGNRGFYVYDTVEKTFQRFNADIAMATNPDAPDNPDGPSSPGSVDNPDPDDEIEEAGIWSQIKSFFSRIFGGKARAIDWFMFGCLIFVLVLIVVLVIFIVYATQKHKEEAEDEDFPLAVNDEKEKSFRKANLFALDEKDQEELGEETTPVDEAMAIEEYEVPDNMEASITAISEDTDAAAIEVTPEDMASREITEPEPQKLYDLEPDSISNVNQQPQETIEPETVAPDPLDFNIEDLKKTDEKNDEKPWSFDDEIGEDFFNDSET